MFCRNIDIQVWTVAQNVSSVQILHEYVASGKPYQKHCDYIAVIKTKDWVLILII